MGIKNLNKLIGDQAPDSMKTMKDGQKHYFSRIIAIDASMALYQFLVAIRNDGSQMTNEDGEITSHLIGMLYRTVRMLENGLKPVYVFDGKPPSMKSGELQKRKEARDKNQKEFDDAKEKGDEEGMDKFNRRLVKVTKEHNEEAKKLLRLMGIPVVTAPCEAEAQATELVKAGKCFAVASEDMDCLTFNCPRLLRNLMKPESKKLPVYEYSAEKLLEELDISRASFIDMCILMGCDYTDSIRGIGPKKAYELIKKYQDIETILENIDPEKFQIPDPFPFEGARRLFVEPEVQDCSEINLKWGLPDKEGMVEFLVKQKGFQEERVVAQYEKLMKFKKKGNQGRIDAFFKPKQEIKTKKEVKKEKKGKKEVKGSAKKAAQVKRGASSKAGSSAKKIKR